MSVVSPTHNGLSPQPTPFGAFPPDASFPDFENAAEGPLPAVIVHVWGAEDVENLRMAIRAGRAEPGRTLSFLRWA